MNDEQLDDLKSFMATTVSQSEQRLRDELGGEISGLREEVREGFAGVAEAIESIHAHLDDHETRITRLETQQADAA